MSNVHTLQLVTESFVIGELVSLTDTHVTLRKPITFNDHFDPKDGPRKVPMPYGAVFMTRDPKAEINITFKMIHVLVDPVPTISELVNLWEEMTSVIETPPKGLIVTK